MDKDTALEESISLAVMLKGQKKILELYLTHYKVDQKLRSLMKKFTIKQRLSVIYQHSKVSNKLILLLLEIFIFQKLKDYQINPLLLLLNSLDLLGLQLILNHKFKISINLNTLLNQ